MLSKKKSIMGLKGKLIMETDIQGSAEKYYNIIKTQVHQFSSAISPGKVGAIKLHEGDWHTNNNVKIWTYTIGGKTETTKEKTEFDDESNTLSFTAIEGDILKKYKYYKLTFQATPSAGTGGTVTITMEYEKIKESDPPPIAYFDFVIDVFVGDFDAHLIKA